jgi:non-specific protein-tyrosine kinase
LPLQDTEVNNLQVMTSGPLPPNPADLLASKRMDALLAQLTEQADLVLLDAPPVTAATDAALLATKVDGVLLVVSAGHTKREHAERAKDLLEKVNANVVGAVLTNAAVDSSAYGDY